MEKLFFTEKELAARWNLSPGTLRQWRWKKKGPLWAKIGGRVCYRMEDVKRFETNWWVIKK